ncbi:hypothetical protein BJX64DRAFT_285270 [Aspergillus heterothallicus]
MVKTTPFITEGAIEFGIALLAVIIRLFSRWKLVGFRKWGGDDYFCILAAVLLNVSLNPSATRKALVTMKLQLLMVPIFLVGKTLGTNTGWTPEEINRFDSGEIDRLTTGSKLVIVGWIGYVSVIWSLKGSVLLYYNRIMSGVSQQMSIRLCAGYCLLSYLAVLLVIFLHCRPFSKNWQVRPDPGLNCSAHYSLYIVVAVLNITSDIFIIYIPIPMIIRLRISLLQKILVGALLGTGVLIIIAALVRCVLSLLSISSTSVTAVWAAREMVVAFVAVNAPAIKPLFNRSTWKSRSRRVAERAQNTHEANSRFGGAQKISIAGEARESRDDAVIAAPAVAVPFYRVDSQTDRSSAHYEDEGRLVMRGGGKPLYYHV